MNYIQKFYLIALIFLGILGGCSSSHENSRVEDEANRIVSKMSTREKVGQKLMMAFRYWCPDDQPNCTTGMTELPKAIENSLRENKIGGVILFSDNLASAKQIKQLTGQLRRTVPNDKSIGMLIGTDEEGGNVFRLSRIDATSFSGNMALGAAYEATKNDQLAFDQGRVLAAEITSIGFNVNFAPVVDVNSNPLNPVINVRSYGDDPATISLLAQRSAQGMASQGVIATFKHFPGHGDTATDSHYGLPIVNKSRADAYAIDLAPYIQAIQSGHSPEMIMTAHIQYPALDNSTIFTRTGEQMITPATMSRKIQHTLLRNELGYQGVTITDALDMKGIANFFDQADAVIKVFQADVDIALMPVEFRTASSVNRLTELIDRVTMAIDAGQIDRAEFDHSVGRIIQMKLRNGVTPSGNDHVPPDTSFIGNPEHRKVERDIAQNSITLLRNVNRTLPLQAQNKKIFIMTPWGEQAEAMRRRFIEHGYPLVTGTKLGDTSWNKQKEDIDGADIIIIGTMATGAAHVDHNRDPNLTVQFLRQKTDAPTVNNSTGSLVFNVTEDNVTEDQPAQGNFFYSMVTNATSEAQQMRDAMDYAKARQKKVIHVTMRSPYDIINYDDISDATLATYSYYGYEGGLRSQSLPAVVDVMLGIQRPTGKLPINIRSQNEDETLGALRYPRGFGLLY